MLREGLEACLIVGILLAYLASIGRKDGNSSVWAGAGAAIFASLAAAAALFATASKFEGRVEQIFEGVASLTAVGVLTWMIFWMRRHAVGFKRALREKMQHAVTSPGRMGLAAVAFVVILREGIETALFAFATVRQAGAGPAFIGGALGLVTAVVLGVGIYQGGVRINLSRFFTLTGAFLLIVAAGLAAHGVHELIEAGIVPAGVERLWNWGSILEDGAGLGAFLKQIFGYNADPSLSEVLVWGVYLLGVGFLFLKPIIRERRAEVAPQSA